MLSFFNMDICKPLHSEQTNGTLTLNVNVQSLSLDQVFVCLFLTEEWIFLIALHLDSPPTDSLTVTLTG